MKVNMKPVNIRTFNILIRCFICGAIKNANHDYPHYVFVNVAEAVAQKDGQWIVVLNPHPVCQICFDDPKYDLKDNMPPEIVIPKMKVPKIILKKHN